MMGAILQIKARLWFDVEKDKRQYKITMGDNR